jgi:hypothetical protein
MSAALLQQAYTVILKNLVKHRRAPHYTELAELLGVSIEEARVLQRDAADAAPAAACWLSHDTDYIEAWGPFSNIPTHVQVSIDGEHGWFGL